MSRGESLDGKRARWLMMAALDGEISEAERKELDGMLVSDAGIREEWERMNRLKAVTNDLAFREPPPEVWEEFWGQVYNRVERGIGWILVSVGTIVVAGFGVCRWCEALWADAELPLLLKLAILTAAVGAIVLVVSVIREKLFTHRRDPYSEVQR